MQPPTEEPRASAKQYAFILVCWGAETWTATVFEGESRILIIGNEDVITTTASGLIVDQAVKLAEEGRDAVIALRRRSRGRPDVVHTVIEPSGDPELMDERPFGARHVVVLTLIFCTLTAFLMLELRAVRRAVSVTRGEASPPGERMAVPDEGGRRG